MRPLALQNLLRTSGLPGLTALAIKSRPHGRYPNLICFKYDQRLSPMNVEAVQDARGIILDAANDWAVVSMSFRKFFNLEEPLAADIDWASARVEEKLDGSLLSLYWWDGAWQVQSSGTADAAGSVVQDIQTRHHTLTYRDLFWQTWQALGYTLPPSPAELGAPYTFAFELMTPENRVVVRHTEARLVLHGVRSLSTLEEEDAHTWAARLGYESVQTFPLSREGLRAAASDIAPMQGEGFVVRDAHFQRVKVKSDAYVQVSLIRESWSERRALELVLLGEQTEFLAYFPEYAAQLEDVQARLLRVMASIDDEFRRIRALPDQKAFAAEATRHPNGPALFALRQGKATDAYAWLLSLGETQRLRALQAAGEVFPAAP